MSHHGIPTGKTTEPTTGAARKSKRPRFGPGRVITIKPPPQGKVTFRDGDDTIGKARGNLRGMVWKPGQPLTPQEKRRRALRKQGGTK